MPSSSTIRRIGGAAAAVLITLMTAFVSSDLDFFKENLLRPFRIRWSAAALENQRAFSVAVHNASSQKIQLLIHQYDLQPGALVDFSSGAFKDGPQISYLDQIGRCSALNNLSAASQQRITHLFDQHYKSLTLLRLQESLEGLWKGESNHHLAAPDLEGFAAEHNRGAVDCFQRRKRPKYCETESEYEEWERFVVSARTQASDTWQKSTGLGVSYDKDFIAPRDGLYFSGTLEPNTTIFLLLRYGSDRVAPITELTTLRDSSTKVSTDEDLQAETWKISWRYHPWLTISLLIVGFLFWWATFAKPTLKQKPLFKVVNVALRTDGTENDEVWDLVYNRIRLNMMSDFRAFCAAFKKASTQLSSAEVFDYLRDRLRLDYGLTGQLLKNSRDLETNMHLHLRDLAARI